MAAMTDPTDDTLPGPDELARRLRTFVVATLGELVPAHLPDLRVPGTFGGHRVEPDVPADLVFTLGWLAEAGVMSVAERGIDASIGGVLRAIDGRNTHTFFSYRVAETLARYGTFAENRLLTGWSDDECANVAAACDSSDWISLLDEGLPRNYAGVLARCELARQSLGLLDDDGAAVLDDLVERVRALLGANPRRYLDDSTHGTARYDIYAADVWLFTEPLAERLGGRWTEGIATALDLVERVGSRDGSAVAWGRSTGVLAAALTVELGALAVAGGHSTRPELWLRRVADATDALGGWFTGGVVNAHQHRSPYGYRGPFRRLQLTLDILGKLAWAAATLGGTDGGPGGATEAPADPVLAAYPWRDELIRFQDDRPAAVWAHRSPGLAFTLPFVGTSRSDYLAAPHDPGTFEVPVDEEIPCWVPLVVARHRTWTAGGVPTSVEHTSGSVTASWDGLVTPTDLDPPADADRRRLPGTCRAGWTVEGRSLRFDLDLTLDAAPDALTVLVPETRGRPLLVEVLDADPAAHPDTIDVDGIKEWRSFWSGLPVLHQVDVDPAATTRLSLRVTPTLRVASTAHGHHYDRSLYGPLAGRAVSRPSPIGLFADAAGSLADIDLFHLHWPEWFGFDDLAAHEHLIAELRAARVPVVWTAHNLTPHEKRPAVYDPIYQRWAETADAVIHHSAWGREQFDARYQVPAGTPQEVIPHGHFGGLYAGRVDGTRAELEAGLGLEPCAVRIGLLGAPRAEKHVRAFLDAVVACGRTDLQVVCWSLGHGETAPDDPRIVIAEPYTMVDATTYARRLAVCDLVALPFDPDGEMLATGVAADVIGMGLGALVSEWGYLTEVLGDAGILMGHTVETMADALDGLTADAVATARAASRARQDACSWEAAADATAALFDRVVLASSTVRPR